MKIIGAINDRAFLVEMGEDEIAKAAGFSSTWDKAFEQLNGGRAIKVGTTFQVAAAFNWHARIIQHQEQAASAGNTLRALADLIAGAMPEIVVPPADQDPKGGDA